MASKSFFCCYNNNIFQCNLQAFQNTEVANQIPLSKLLKRKRELSFIVNENRIETIQCFYVLVKDNKGKTCFCI